MSSPASLRDLYTDTSSTWSFAPSNTTQPVNVPPSVPPPSRPFTWANRPAHNSIFDLAPSLDLNEPAGIQTSDLLRTLLASALLQYTSSAIAMPWEVGKLLLQVQWVPRHEPDSEPEHEDLEDELSDDSNDDDNASYFTDPSGTPAPRLSAPRAENTQRRHLGDITEYSIPAGNADGVWGMIKLLTRFRGEGWLALWKGLLTSCASDVLSATVQPIIQSLLQSIFGGSSSPFQQPSVVYPITAHVITGFILSPLDLVRTRLVVQSLSATHRTYTGPLNALAKIAREEGGLKGIYLHPQLLVPTLIDSALRPMVSVALPGILASYLGAAHITADTNPIAWGFAELAGSCLGLLITLPFETVRRRLQVQTRGTARPIKGCVQLRPAPYNGVVDTFWHILKEERSDLPIVHHPRLSVAALKRRNSKGKQREGEPPQTLPPHPDEDGMLRNTGVGQLYRGLGMRLGASVIVFFLSLVTGDDRRDGGWAEL